MSEKIHQEIVFEASPDRVYRALIDEGEFTAVTGGAEAKISTDVGGEFSCFNGQIVGRQVELVPNQLIVQDWRAAAWANESRVRFELKREGDSTRLVFDHTGFPEGEQEHLEGGWHKMYWEPLKKYLG